LVVLFGDLSQAQEIHFRISVKFILDAGGHPPGPGGWTDADHWRTAIELANAGNARLGRGFRYLEPTFDGSVSGASEYFILTDGEQIPFEEEARTNPAYLWRGDAINVYVVQENLGCAGWASPPSVPQGSLDGGRIVVLCVGTGPFSVIPHEFGHHFDLIHTWDDDLVADTPTDASPYMCLPDNVVTPEDESCIVGGTDGCCCSTQVSNTLDRAATDIPPWTQEQITLMLNNLMSYQCDINEDFDLSEGQLDRYTDAARRYLAAEGTGVTYFVDGDNASPAPYDGYSTDPFPTVADGVAAATATGGNIVLIRPGAYAETGIFDKTVTLRAMRNGLVSIGE